MAGRRPLSGSAGDAFSPDHALRRPFWKGIFRSLPRHGSTVSLSRVTEWTGG